MDAVQDANSAGSAVAVDVGVFWRHVMAVGADFLRLPLLLWFGVLGLPSRLEHLHTNLAKAMTIRFKAKIIAFKWVATKAYRFVFVLIYSGNSMIHRCSTDPFSVSPAYPAPALRSVFGFNDVKVIPLVGMPIFTGHFWINMNMAMLRWRHLLEMARVNAASAFAGMVDWMPRREIRDKQLVRGAVRQHWFLGGYFKSSIPGLVQSPLPKPTSRFRVQFNLFNESFNSGFGWASSFHGINEKGPRPDSKTGDRDATMPGRRPKFVDLDSCQSYLTRLSMPNLSPIVT
jgi:hypothetical protein